MAHNRKLPELSRPSRLSIPAFMVILVGVTVQSVIIQRFVTLQVKYTSDKRSVMVTTNEKAPGGVRTEKVGLPYDPDLFDHMVEHGVHIEVPSPVENHMLYPACKTGSYHLHVVIYGA